MQSGLGAALYMVFSSLVPRKGQEPQPRLPARLAAWGSWPWGPVTAMVRQFSSASAESHTLPA